MDGSVGAGPARHRCQLASRRVPRMLEPSLAAAAGKTVHRFTTSRPHLAHGRRERSVGRSADPGGVTEARIRRLRTNGVPLSPSPTQRTATDVAYIPPEPSRRRRGYLDGDVIVRAE